MAKAKKKAKSKKKATKKSAKKKTTAKKTAKKAKGKAKAKAKPKVKKKRKPNAAFMAPLTPSAELAEVIGGSPAPRTMVVKKMWDYIKRHGLQDSSNKRMINADERLRAVFDGRSQVSMFEMAKLINKHLR